MSKVKDHSTRNVSHEVGIAGMVVAAAITMPAVLLATRFVAAVADFDALFKGFGADLPALTRFIITYSLPIAIGFRLCVAGQVVFLILLIMNRTFEARRKFWFFSILTLGAMLTLIVAFCAPAFRMGPIV